MYAAIAEAIEALRDHEKLKDTAERLRKTVKSQEEKISDLLVIIRAHELNSGDTMQICPKCQGAGAIIRGPDDAEECLRCDGVGAIVKKTQ